MSKQRLIYSTFILFGVLLGMGLGNGIGKRQTDKWYAEHQKRPCTLTVGAACVVSTKDGTLTCTVNP